ncbi:MAG TPA: phosphoribosylformylglycinamidine synthase subunit PurL [Actinomycetota bacterium]|nr:phosphoribosylformylglycinamidine synthase subunit PurL [Actinomycetota bacterium]
MTTTSSELGAELYRSLGLTDDEFARIKTILGREPNRAELAMYSVMWSEHCSYKSSRIHLKTLPSEGPHVLVGPGEGAGVIDVDGVAVALRLESHNHPSFVEPFQGAATGIGGIVRDVLSMGARPIALLDPLRFGPLPAEQIGDAKVAERNRVLVEGVVSGISSYGNCIGVPTVGGEIKFEGTYSGNPLVNVMCIGVAPKERIMKARAEGVGNKVLLLGSTTGRDGIGGVSVLASATFGEEAEALRPSVQVGDPFTEKLLIEGCLRLIELGLVVGIQDLGGAGLCCATSESAANAGTGMRLDLGQVALRESGMEPFEILTSESQERMLVIVEPKDLDAALAECERMGLRASVVGEVTDSKRLEVVSDGEVVADVPAASLGDGPVYDRPIERPSWVDALSSETIEPPDDIEAGLMKLIGSPNIASKRWAWEQYDHQVMLGTVVRPGADAAVLRIPGTSTRIAVTTDGNGRYCYLDPRGGAQHSVAEAYRNLSALGAEPVAITNCLNFGNPERPEVMWQFAEAVRGIGEACISLGTPVTGGNVSFYNETGDVAIYPTPIIGMVGVMPEDVVVPGPGWRKEGDVILLLGATGQELGGSEYARTVLGKVSGKLPALDLEIERAVGTVAREAIRAGLCMSAHDLSEGGLAVALAEACAISGLGAQIDLQSETPAWELFSESASRILLSVSESAASRVLEIASNAGVPARRIGVVSAGSLRGPGFDLDVAEISSAFHQSFAAAMGYPSASGESSGNVGYS